MDLNRLRFAAALFLTVVLAAAPAVAAPGDVQGVFGQDVLDNPHGPVGIDAAGTIYVNDYGNGDLKVFDPAYTLLESWNETHPDREYPQYPMFLNPHNLAIHGDRVYVVNAGHDKVEAYTLDGIFLFEISGPAWPYCGWDPSAIAIDDLGNLYITDLNTTGLWYNDPETYDVVHQWCGRRVLVYDGDGNFQRFIGTPGTDPNRTPGADPDTLGYPEGVAVDAAGTVYVTDQDRVVIYDKYGTWQRTFGSHGSGPGQFDLAMGPAIDKDGRIFIADAFNNRVQVLENDGTFITSFGTEGTEPGQFRTVTGVKLDPDNNRMFVTDMWNSRIQVLEGIPVTECTGYLFEGFLPPVSLGLPIKAGSVIPVRFRLVDCAGRPVNGVSATLAVTTVQMTVLRKASRLRTPIPGFENQGDGIYHSNLSTRGMSPGTYVLTVRLDDGTEQRVTIKLK